MKDRSGYLSIIQGLTANSVCVQSLSASGNEGNSFGQAHAGSNVGGEDERFWLFCRFNASSHPLSTHADEFIFIIILYFISLVHNRISRPVYPAISRVISHRVNPLHRQVNPSNQPSSSPSAIPTLTSYCVVGPNNCTAGYY